VTRAVRAAVGVALLVAVAGCGGGDEGGGKPESARPDAVTLTPAPDGTQSVDVDADDSYRFHPSLINAKPGPVRLTLHNIGQGTPHDWAAAEVSRASVPLIRGGETRDVTFTVSKPGDYRFVCTLHERQGQVGRLVVSAP
jgi:plastocyanin